MKKIFLFLILCISFAFGTIDETKTDVYFGNGILTKEGDAEDNAKLLEKAIKKEIYGNNEDEMYKHIGKVYYAYNRTWDRSHDLLEAYLQLDREAPDFFEKLKSFWGYFISEGVIDEINDEIAAVKVDEQLVRLIHAQDIHKQIMHYKNSIKQGHKILIVAHSQGALFANEVYEILGLTDIDSWMQSYILSVFVAPSSSFQLVKKNHSPSFTFDNDPIAKLAKHFKFKIVNNPNKYYKPIKNQWGESTYYIDSSYSFHAFSYYLGKKVAIDDYKGYREVSTDIGKEAILGYIKSQLDILNKIPSQWKTIQEEDKGTCSYHIEVKHRFDLSMEIGELIYPFSASGKIYQVRDENGQLQYVKASCCAKNILTQWSGKKDNECYMIDNEKMEKIVKDSSSNDGNTGTGGDNGNSGGGSTINASNFDINSCGVDIPFGSDIAIKKALENVDISDKTNEEITKRFCEIIKNFVENSNKKPSVPKPGL